ncbi:MAG: glycosyltransferase family 2 protein [Puniceicoccaceae bacterium]
MPDLSIITALYNCHDLTRAFVQSLQQYTAAHNWELVLVNDASTESTAALEAEFADDSRIRWLHNTTNLGFAASNNRGASVAKAPLLAFLNNDLLLTENWLQPMLDAFHSSENVGIVGNIQFNPNTRLIDHAGVFFGLDGMPRQARKHRKLAPTATTTEWYAVTAACMLIEKALFEQAGGFDTAYRNGFEDIDLCVRLRLQGRKHYVANQSRIFHCVSSSPGRHQHNDANAERFRKQWASTTQAWGERDWAPEYLQRYARQWWRFNFGKWRLARRMLRNDRMRQRLHYRP